MNQPVNQPVIAQAHPLSESILACLRASLAQVGDHVSAQALANQLQVSRFPITQSFAWLAEQGWLKREANRGYFLAKDLAKALPARNLHGKQRSPAYRLDDIYLAIADDRLRGRLPDTVSQMSLRERYQLSQTELQKLLARMASEGWISQRRGYGWTFSNMLTTPESLAQSYRLRLALEPAALLEPNYHLDANALAACRAAEQDLLDGGIASATAEQLHERGVRFHETLVVASGNPFFIEPLKRVNRVRRLLSYRSMQNRDRYVEHAKQHLRILALLEKGDTVAASRALQKHLQSTLTNLEKIKPLLS